MSYEDSEYPSLRKTRKERKKLKRKTRVYKKGGKYRTSKIRG